MSDPISPAHKEPSSEYQRYGEDLRRRDAERAHDKNHEAWLKTSQAAVAAGNQALRVALLINGGAAVSLLTFVGALPVDKKAAIASTLSSFAWGVAAAALGVALAYCTNYCETRAISSRSLTWDHPWLVPTRETRRWGAAIWVFQLAAIACCISSLGLFVYGMQSVKQALQAL